MKDILKSYFLSDGTEIPVLKGIHLDIKQGEFIALMGQSGSGKSTLLNIIGFLHASSGGTYHFNEEEVAEFKDDDILSYIRNQKIGFVFQQYFLIARMTALENVMLPSVFKAGLSNKQKYDKAFGLLEKVGLADKYRNKPSELSGGQQQRVAIARALMNDPELILADEPTGALDSESGNDIMQLITDLHKQGTTVIMVTHDQYVAEYAQRIIFLKDGIVLDDNYSFIK